MCSQEDFDSIAVRRVQLVCQNVFDLHYLAQNNDRSM